ncbi:hypothetical protein WA026_021589 [Henosepilachna vigintioctopunctata]|uniref:Uncharacterized protein n=1 Tax=Henosepilachna vigintioctopunctata TaxID=420089 RepID=A0AAW1V1F2_9CUCU
MVKDMSILSILIIYWEFCNSLGQSTDRHSLLAYERVPIHKGENERWECYDKRDYEMEYECRSKSKDVNTIPTDLGSNVTTLILAEADIKIINKRAWIHIDEH